MQEVEGTQLRMAEGEVRIASHISGLTGKGGAEGEDPAEQPREGTSPGSQISVYIKEAAAENRQPWARLATAALGHVDRGGWEGRKTIRKKGGLEEPQLSKQSG